MLSRNRCSVDPSRELVEQIAQQLATRAVRDTELEEADVLSGDEYVAIIQDGKSKKVSVQPFLDGADIPIVSYEEDGLMSTRDKVTLDEIADAQPLTNLELEELLK